MEPTPKSASINDAIRSLMGKDREQTIRDGNCMTCDRTDVVEGLRDEHRREYRISGMCAHCQDNFYGEDRTDGVGYPD
jgi:hypothetical protein